MKLSISDKILHIPELENLSDNETIIRTLCGLETNEDIAIEDIYNLDSDLPCDDCEDMLIVYQDENMYGV